MPSSAAMNVAERVAPAPSFLCIGAQKAGTTWLYTILKQNPEVFLPPMKETHFFDFIYVPSHRRWIPGSFDKALRKFGGHAVHGPYMARLTEIPRDSDAWYARVFDHPDAAGRRGGEITPAYAILPSAGIARVRSVNPAMKIILVIRDPVDRALSQLRMAAAWRGWQNVGTAEAERADLMPAVLARSAYRESIARWEAVFPPEQILYLPYAQIRNAPAALLRRVEDFLGLPPHRYRALGKSIYKSQPVAVEPEVVSRLERRLKAERDYLAERFGDAFGR